MDFVAEKRVCWTGDCLVWLVSGQGSGLWSSYHILQMKLEAPSKAPESLSPLPQIR